SYPCCVIVWANPFRLVQIERWKATEKVHDSAIASVLYAIRAVLGFILCRANGIKLVGGIVYILSPTFWLNHYIVCGICHIYMVSKVEGSLYKPIAKNVDITAGDNRFCHRRFSMH